MDQSYSDNEPSTSNGTVTRTEVINSTGNDVKPPPQEQPTLRLSLHKRQNDKKVSWNSGTIDNEHMGKKKSKCCCIYKKPLEFGESSSESDDDECDHCTGHVEKKKKHHQKHGEDLPPDDPSTNSEKS